MNIQLKDVIPTLKRVFGFEDLREQQKPIVSTVLENRDMLAILKTSGGKSLCYQLPAIHRPGMTLVISPLISLMKDQVDALNHINVSSSYANSSIDVGELHQRYKKLSKGEYKLFYVSPERFLDDGFISALLKSPVSVIAVDEAHCASQWGHNFRPSYSKLGAQFDLLEDRIGRKMQRIAFTATANSKVQADICSMLGLVDPVVHIQDFDRANLSYAVIPCAKQDRIEDIVQQLEENPGVTSIIYCVTVKEVEKIFAKLKEYGINVDRYHGRLDSDEKTRVQDDFIKGNIKTLVSTSAFGMGVDKSDVRLVIHAQMPGSLEAWYQEAGRAGRDGEPAKAVLLYHENDKSIHRYFINVSSPSSNKVQPIRDVIYSQLRHGSRPLDPRRLAMTCDSQIAVINRWLPESGVKIEKISYIDVQGTLNLLKNQGEIDQFENQFSLAEWSDDIDYSWIDEVKLNSWAKFNAMCSWAETNLCRRWQILRYFDERKPHYNCGNCDNCQREALQKQSNNQREKAVRPGTLMTLANAIDAIGLDDKKRWVHILLGSTPLSELNSEEAEYSGRFTWHAVGDLLRWKSLLIENNIINQTGHLTEHGKGWIDGKIDIDTIVQQNKPKDDVVHVNEAVKNKRVKVLRNWRRSVAYREDQSEIVIATEGQLRKIAEIPVLTEKSLEESGLNVKWIKKYSTNIIKAIDSLEEESSPSL